MPDVTTPFGNGPENLTSPSAVTALEAPVAPDLGRQPAAAPTLEGHEQNVLDRIQNGSQQNTQAAPESQPQLGGFSGGAPLDTQRDMSVGMTTDEKAKILAMKYGAGNVRVQDDEIYFRNPGQQAFQKASASTMDVVHSILSGDLQGAADAGQSMLASHAEGLGQMGGNTAAMMAGGTLGGIGAGLLAGPEAMPLGARAGMAAGAGIESYLSSQSRQSAIDDILNQKSDPKLATENATHEASLSALLSAGGDFVMGSINKLSKGAQMAIDDYPLNKAKSMVLLKKEIDDAAESFGARGAYESGNALQGAIEIRKKNIGQLYIGKYDQIVEDAADQTGEKVPVDTVLAKMKDILQKQNVQFQGDVPISAPGIKIPRSMSIDPAFETGHITFDELMQSISPQQSAQIRQNMGMSSVGNQVENLFQAGPYFGSETGKQSVEQIINDYQRLLTANQNDGGLKVSEFRKWEQLYGARGNYDPDKKIIGGAFSGAEQAVARQIDEAFSQDKVPFYQKMLGDSSPEGQSFLMDSYRYQTEKDAIKRLQTTLGKGDVGPEIILNKALTTNDPQVIRDLKGLFGTTDPELIGNLRGSMLKKAIADNTDLNGMVNLPGISRSFKDYNPMVVGELFSKPELRKVTSLMDRADQMISSDFKPDKPGVADTLGSLVGVLWNSAKLDVPAAAKNFYSVFGRNQDAYNYLTETLLPQRLEMAKSSRDFVGANNVASLMESLSDFRTLSKEVKIGNRTILVPMPALKQTFVQAGKSAIQQDSIPLKQQPAPLGR